jgi:DNA-binding transcriptional MocR family regulator
MKPTNQVNGLAPSFIREILKSAVCSEVISFAGGLPAPETFASEMMQAGFDKIPSHQHLYQYGQTQGYGPLISFLMALYDVAPLNDLLITNGSQQGLDLIARTYINPGDAVVIEDPSYLGAIQVFQLAQARLTTVGQQDCGPNLEELEQIFKQGDIKFFYFIADFNNPTGVTYSLSARKQVAYLCDKYKVTIIEDAPYRELRFSGEQLPLVSSFSKKSTFILRSFSKIACPGMRIGVLEADSQSIQSLIKVKQITDLHTNNILQFVLLECLKDPRYQVHLSNLKAYYKKKYDFMYQLISKELSGHCRIHPIEGGMFIWLEIQSNKEADIMKIAQKLLALGVAVVPGAVFQLPQNRVENTIRLNFSFESMENTTVGIQKLAEVIKSEY